MKKTLLSLAIVPIVIAGLTVSFAHAGDADVVKPTTDFSKAEAYELLPAGGLTHRKKLNADAFSHASANMSFERELDFKIGNAFFKRIWVSSPASTTSSDGLGPLFNARACQRCHIKDGLSLIHI